NNAPPPVKSTANASRAAQPKQGKNAALTEQRAQAITQLGVFAQVPLVALKQYADVGTIDLHWKNVSTEIAKLAESQDQIARIVDPLMQVGPYAGLITAVLPMVLQFAVNHGR